MKKLLTVLFAFFFITVNAQNIPNRGFEVWEDEFQFEAPNYWLTSNLQDGRINSDKSTDAHSGDFAIKLYNKPDSSFGYFLMGTVGEEGPDHGAPYSSDFDSVTGWYKSDIPIGDTALVLAFKYGQPDSSMSTFKIFGTTSSWTRFSFPVPSHSQTEVFFGVVSTDPFNDNVFNPNSWILVDDVTFVKSGGPTPLAIQNHSFEIWDSITSHEPVGWNSLNLLSVSTGDTLSVQKTTDAHSGNYAVKLVTVDIENRSKVGWLYNGDPPGPGGFKGGFEYNAVPSSFSGYYKYEPVGPDTAIVAIIGSVYDSVNDTSLNVFFGVKELYATSTYTQFTIPINYDTAIFHINQMNVAALSTRKLFDYPELANSGSALFLDDLWLESKCAYADTSQLFTFSDTIISYKENETPYFSMDTSYLSYLWNTGDTSFMIELTMDTSMLVVTVRDSNGCFIMDELNIVLNELLGVGSETLAQFKVYPNPVLHSFSVYAEGKTQLLIYNANAQLAQSVVLQRGLNLVDVRTLSSGLYTLEFLDEKAHQAIRVKIIKN